MYQKTPVWRHGEFFWLNPKYENHVRTAAEQLLDASELFIIGRNELFPIAMESAIKIQEVSYINAQGFAAGELKHGPIALVEDGVWVIVLGSDPETISNAIEVQSRGAKVLGISEKNNDVFDIWLDIPESEHLKSITTLIPIQLLSYYLAILKNLDPDMPRNLAKSVTVK